jgi:hypothetical protein
MRLQRPPALDLALAGALLVLDGAAALTGDTALPRALTVALTAGYTLPLAFRRQAPLTTAALSTACVLLFGAVDPDNSQPTLPLALALAAYTAGAEVELPRSAVAAAAGLSVFLAALFAADAPAADAIFVCVLYGAPYLSGALLRPHGRPRGARAPRGRGRALPARPRAARRGLALDQKLRLPDRVQAVIFAYETGLVRPGAA